MNPGEEVTVELTTKATTAGAGYVSAAFSWLPRRPDLWRHGDDPEDHHQALRRGQGQLGQARDQRHDGQLIMRRACLPIASGRVRTSRRLRAKRRVKVSSQPTTRTGRVAALGPQTSGRAQTKTLTKDVKSAKITEQPSNQDRYGSASAKPSGASARSVSPSARPARPKLPPRLGGGNPHEKGYTTVGKPG